jgi:RNA polymerase sigma-70 factor (ECF subfamily)
MFPTFAGVEASIGQVTPDGDLVDQVRAGNHAAFGELVERHQGAVYRAALAALGNAADAEDIAQDALVLAFKRIDQFRGDASVRTWMISIAWRLSLSRRRRMWWRVSRRSEPEAVLDAMSSTMLEPDARLAAAELSARLKREIRALPQKLRDALLLTAAGDLTQEEIAAALNVPAATFRGRVRDARVRLRGKLQNDL